MELQLDFFGAQAAAPVAPATPKVFTFPADFDPAAGERDDHLRANLEALRLSAKLAEAGRLATPAERLRLAGYIGWGGLAEVFDDVRGERYESQRRELAKLLGKDAIAGLRHSTLSAHYTPLLLVRFVWACIARMGFSGGRVLEPAVGTGNFIGAVPPELADKCDWHACELEEQTARLAEQIYTHAKVRAGAFQESRLPDNYFDLAIGNVPFGDVKIADVSLPKAQIHDYFFLRSLRHVRPGGIVAFITSTGTLDKSNGALRRYIAQRALFVAAFRFPSCAFSQCAHTEATTDLILLKRRALGSNLDDVSAEPWIGTAEFVPSSYASTRPPLNQWFHAHPEHVLGTLEIENWRKRIVCELEEPSELPARLEASLKLIPVGCYTAVSDSEAVSLSVGEEAKNDDKNGAFAFDSGGRLCVNKQGRLEVLADISANGMTRIRAMMAIRDCARALLGAASGGDEMQANGHRQTLNQLYDAFIGRHGFLNATANRRLFRSDPEAPLLLALENFDPDDEEATSKAALFAPLSLRRIDVRPGSYSAEEALAVCLNQKGRIDQEHISFLAGKEWGEVWNDLNGSALFIDPETRTLATAEEYLSGNVRTKLATAAAASDHDQAFNVNVRALEAVQPTPLQPGEITANLGAGWIPTEHIREFIAELLGLDSDYDKPDVFHVPTLGSWRIENAFGARRAVASSTQYGTSRANAVDLIDCGLNMRMPIVSDPKN